ncbi:MAG: S41 family peptidase [Bacteroidales bacterium]|nr:S41 family peptidase [Bacteroidales bacterium]
MNNIFRKIIAVSTAVMFFVPFVSAQFFNENSLKLLRTLDYIYNRYVDTVNQKQLVDAAIEGMLSELDPHSSYLNVEQAKEMDESMQGNFEGIGVSFNILNDTIFIINVISGGPSQKVGVQAGDKIIRIDGNVVAGQKITNKEVMKKLRGPKGTKVTITVLRRGVDELLDFTIVRDKIPLNSVDAAYMINSETGYIKLDRFSQTTSTEFAKAIKKLLDQKAKNLIVDLTDNGGGVLNEAIMLADHFLEKDRLVVYTKGAHVPRQEFRATNAGLFEKGKLVVLINENSASASEIFAGAIQDWDRGIIVGRRSFGKGLVQNLLDLGDGTRLRLTIAHYYTPTGRDIQKPYKKGQNEEYEKDILYRLKSGELTSKDSVHFSDSLKFYTLINKRVVYGGGGIMPDIFVPIDTTKATKLYRDAFRTGAFNRFVLNYVDVNRKNLMAQYPTFALYKQNFNAQSVYPQLIDFLKKEKIEIQDSDVESSKATLSRLLKAFIARDIWESNEFYEIYNEDEPIVQEALKILKDYDTILKGSSTR